MATSFAAYASQFLNRQQQPNAGSSSLTSTQPMFFSFTTDNGSRDGHNPDDSDIDDLDDPHLRTSAASRPDREYGRSLPPDDDEDPYLRLDEDDGPQRFGAYRPHTSRYDHQNMPLISSSINDSGRAESPRGWLAHQASPLRPPRSPTPSPPSSSTSSSPPPDIFGIPGLHGSPRPLQTSSSIHQPPPPRTSREPVSLSLTQSLLPRDGVTRPMDVFSLPDPRHTPRSRRKYQDSVWTALWCFGLTVCLISSFLVLFLTHKPNAPKKYPSSALPYTTLLHTVPMLTILTFLCAGAAYIHIYLLRLFVKPVMIATSVFVPATLLISAIWAFVGSFMWDGDAEPTWGETIGLRLFSLIPLLLALVTARRLLYLPRTLHTASSMLVLTTDLLAQNPYLLALSPIILLCSLLLSIPFLTLIFRLLLIGNFTQENGGWEWHVKGWANWAIVFTVVVWLWTWGVARGILKMTCAAVIGAWYFADPSAPILPPTSTHTIHAALTRSTSSSLGTVALSALILASIRLLTLLAVFLTNVPTYASRVASTLTTALPPSIAIPLRTILLGAGTSMLRASLLQGIAWCVRTLEGMTGALSRYALVYAGLTGDAFMNSARRARALTQAVEQRDRQARRRLKSESPLTLLTIAPLTLTFPFALSTYLFVAHTLAAPDQALGASILAGGVTALVGLFSVGLIEDTADTLYMCYCIDRDVGQQHRKEVFNAIEYEPHQERAHRTRQNHDQVSPTSPLAGPVGQQVRRPSNAEPRHPLPQPSPSPEDSPPLSNPILSPAASFPARISPHLSPPPRSPVDEERDIDPFKQSYLEDEPGILPQFIPQQGIAQSPRPRPAPQVHRSPPPFAMQARASLTQSLMGSGTHSRTGSHGHVVQSRVVTPAELSQQPISRIVSPDPHLAQSDPFSDEGSVYPGSGFL